MELSCNEEIIAEVTLKITKKEYCFRQESLEAYSFIHPFQFIQCYRFG